MKQDTEFLALPRYTFSMLVYDIFIENSTIFMEDSTIFIWGWWRYCRDTLFPLLSESQAAISSFGSYAMSASICRTYDCVRAQRPTMTLNEESVSTLSKLNKCLVTWKLLSANLKF